MIDQSVTDYINSLKEKFYLDANIQKSGANLLSEMLAFTRNFVEIRKRQAGKQQDFLSKRLARVLAIKTEIDTLAFNYGLFDKYDIFWSNSRDLAGTSDYMDSVIAKISFTVTDAIRKVRAYKREYSELQYKIAQLQELLDFYDTAETELTNLEAEL